MKLSTTILACCLILPLSAFSYFSSSPHLPKEGRVGQLARSSETTASDALPILPPDCPNAVPISCGTVLLNQTTAGGGNDFNRLTNYSCLTGISDDYNALDRIYRITVNERKSVRFVLEMQADRDLDLFLFNTCNSTVNCIDYSATFNGNGNPFLEVLEVTLNPGITYYLVVDGYTNNAAAIGTFNLEVNCNCNCTEAATNQPDGFKILADDFGDYVPNQLLDPQSTRWRKWSTASGDAPVEVLGGSQVMHVQRNPNINNNTDVLYLLNNATSGSYRLSWDMYVEPGKRGYYDVLHTAPNLATGAGGNIAFKVDFNGDGTGLLTLGSNPALTFPFQYPQGVWFKVVNIIDLNGSATFTASTFINTNFVSKWDFDSQGQSPLNRLAAISFAAVQDADFYVDNLCIWEKDPACNANAIYMPVCAKNGVFFDNEQLARCNLFTGYELWPCYTACDLGGTFVYRGDQINGGFSYSDFGFADDPANSCQGQANVPFFMDVYIFYQDDSDDWDINFNNNGNNQTQYFIFGCNVPTGPGNSCQFERGECFVPGASPPEAIPCNRFYYITVIGPLGATYSFNVIPEGPCQANPTQLVVGSAPTTVNGTLGANNFAADQYLECYNGSRAYSGGEKIYKFTLSQSSQVSLTLNSPGGVMGMFLSSFVCGNDCVNFAETTASQSTTTMSTFLSDGTYYVIIDKATTAGVNNFSLTLEQQSLPLFYSFPPPPPPDEGSCVNNNEKHIVQIQHTAYNFSAFDNIYFLFRDTDGRLKTSDSLYRSWHNLQQPMLFRIPADLPNDGMKCSYAPGDSFIIYVQLIENGTRVIKELIPKYRSINPPGVTAGKFFTVGAGSVIDSFSVRTVRPFGSHTLELNPPSTTGSSTIAFSTNLPWAVDNPGSDWITLDPSFSDGSENINASFTANPSEAPRSAVLRFYATGAPDVYRQYIRVEQRGVCNPNPQLAINASETTICPGDTSLLTAAVGIGLEGVFNYLWSTGATTPSIRVAPSVASNYSVTITNNQPGCTATKSASISVGISSLPQANAGLGATLTCASATVQLSGTGSPSSTYTWSGPGIVSGGNSLTPVVNEVGLYTLTVTNFFGCERTASTTVIRDTTPPTAEAGPERTLLCNPTTVQLQGSALVGNTVIWSGPGIVSGGTTLTPTVNASGTYTLSVTSATNGCTASDQVSVLANTTLPAAEAGPERTLLCNPTAVQLEGSALASNTVIWSGPGIVSGGTTLTPTVNASGTYTLSVTSATNGCTASDQVSVIANTTLPTAEAGPERTLLCNPSTVQLQGSALAGNTVIWSGPGIVSGGSTLTPTINATGTYTLSVTSADNGCTASDQVSVIANTTPPAAEAGLERTLLCNPSTVQLQGSALVGNTVIWSGPGIVSGGTTLTPTVNATGTYTLSVTSTDNGCTASDQVSVIANTTLPTAEAGPERTLLCNPSTVQLQGSALAGNTVIWSGPGIVSGGSTLTPTINATGTYTLSVTSADNGCTASDQVSVIANTTPPAAEAGLERTLLCNPNTVQLQGSALVGNTVIWSGPGIVSGGTTLTPMVNTAGTYTLSVTSADNGCTASDQVSVIANTTPPTAEAGPERTLLCNPSTVQLQGSASAGSSLIWSGPGIVSGGTTLTPTVDQVGVYTLTVTRPDNGCTASDEVVVTGSTALPTAAAGPGQQITCLVESVQLQGTGSVGANFIYQWSGPGIVSGETTLTPIVNAAGQYTLLVTNQTNNCSASASTSVVVNNTPPVADAGPNVPLGCAPNQVLLFGSGSVGSNFSYSWTGPGIVSGADQLSPTVNIAGSYILTIRNTANGCETADATTVIPNNQAPFANAGPPRVLSCVPPTIFLSGSGSTGPQYLYNWDGPGIVSGSNSATVEINQPGAYSLMVTNLENGCSTSSSTTVSPSVAPEVGITAPPIISCANNRTVQLSGSYSPPGAPVSISWTGPGIVSGGSTPAPLVNQAGIYTMQVTITASGCPGSAQVIVSIDTLLPPGEAGPDRLICPGASVQLGLGNTPSPDIQYTWTPNTSLDNAAAASPVATPAASQVYQLLVRSLNNQCTRTDSVRVTVVPPLFSDIAASQPINCYGDSTGVLLANITGGQPLYTIIWSNGAQGAENSSLASGHYTAYITDAIGCRDTVEYNLVDPLPLLAMANLSPADLNQNNGFIVVELEGGTPPYTYAWFDGNLPIGNDEGAIDSLPPGDDYRVLITDANACTLALGPLSILVGTREPEWAHHLAIFPNPGTGQFYLRLSAPAAHTGLQVQVGDALGRIIQQYTPDQWRAELLEIDLSGQSPGLFWIRIIKDGQVVVKPVLMVKL